MVKKNSQVLEEIEIRTALSGYVQAGMTSGDLIREEFRIERGGARIDMALIGSSLVGYEIKSDKDTFARFSNQIHAYNRVFDQIHLVCGPTHAKMAEMVLPSWWGLMVAYRDENGTVHLEGIRAAGINPKQDAFSLASLLWKEEAIAVLAMEETKVSSKASCHKIWECISTTLPVDRIKSRVSQALLNRQSYNWADVKTI